MQLSLVALISILSVFAAQDTVVAAPVPSPMRRFGTELVKQGKEQLKGKVGDQIKDALTGSSTNTPTTSVNGRQLMNDQKDKDKAAEAARAAQLATQQAHMREVRQSTPAQHPPSTGGGIANHPAIAAGFAAQRERELHAQKGAAATAAAAKATTGVADRQRKIAEMDQAVQARQRANLGLRHNKRSIEDLD